jgi:hypothetical protein
MKTKFTRNNITEATTNKMKYCPRVVRMHQMYIWSDNKREQLHPVVVTGALLSRAICASVLLIYELRMKCYSMDRFTRMQKRLLKRNKSKQNNEISSNNNN